MTAIALTSNQKLVFLKVASASGWYRAGDHGERVTLASLYARGLLTRREWRVGKSSADSAYEYRLEGEPPEVTTRGSTSGPSGASVKTERQGFCAAERILWCWRGELTCEQADCPSCGLPLMHRPGPKSIGAHRIENGMPKRRAPELVQEQRA